MSMDYLLTKILTLENAVQLLYSPEKWAAMKETGRIIKNNDYKNK